MHYTKNTANERPTLLFVDDDSEDCLLMRMALRESGLDMPVQEVENGQQLLTYIRADLAANPGIPFVPWIIILDKNMPELGGFDTLMTLKSDPVLGRVPVVLFINPDHAEDRRFCRGDGPESLGATACVAKPTDFARMKALMQDIYELWRETNRI